jgi:hypothetical protein
MAAYSLHHDKSPMGDYLRRMKSRLGPVGATTATAHKIAIIFYTMVKKQVEYDATLWASGIPSVETIRGETQAGGANTYQRKNGSWMPANCGARTRACSVHTRVNALPASHLVATALLAISWR